MHWMGVYEVIYKPGVNNCLHFYSSLYYIRHEFPLSAELQSNSYILCF